LPVYRPPETEAPMSTTLQLPDFADTLRYRILVQRALPQDDVRLTVPVTALVHTRDHDQAALRKSIRDALNAFVAAEWTFSHIERGGDAVGYERVQLTATARVGSSENYDLAERARRAGREGLTLGQPRVDYALSPEKVDEVVRTLRLEALERVQAHIAEYDAITGRAWRIGDIACGVEDAQLSAVRSSKGAYRDSEDALLALENASSSGLSGAERIRVVVTVTLRAAPPATRPPAD